MEKDGRHHIVYSTDINEINKELSSVTSKDGNKYIATEVLGSGSFGIVFKATIEGTDKVVAIKKVYQDRRYKNRELSILKELDHPNVVRLLDYFSTRSQDNEDEEYLNLIMDFMPETLYKELRTFNKAGKPMPMILIKVYSYQLIRALAYIHALGICHRDLKPQNILTDPDLHTLKLCDFGSAKHLVAGESNVSYISSRPYRAPELIFGAVEYTPAIDIWSAGCCIAELILEQPIFAGENSLEQIVEIIKVLGTPNKRQIQAMNPEYTEYRFPVIKPYPWEKVFKGKDVTPEFCDLIGKMLIYDPEQRTRPLELLSHPFFDELRNKDTKLPNEKDLPDLFDFNDVEMKINRKFIMDNLIPSWYAK